MDPSPIDGLAAGVFRPMSLRGKVGLMAENLGISSLAGFTTN